MVTADAPQGFRISLDYSRDLFDDATVTGMLDDLVHLLETVIEHPQQAISALARRSGVGTTP
jgi:non-ribosomal peptide synthetase component F